MKECVSLLLVVLFFVGCSERPAKSTADSRDNRQLPSKDQLIAEVAKLRGLAQVDKGKPHRPVITVNFSMSKLVTDEWLVNLKRFPELEWLLLTNTQIGDAGLVHLGKLTSLRKLALTGTMISDAGLVHLYGLHNLEQLDIQTTRVTESGVRRLKAAIPQCTVSY